jgi:hypothetical protein
MTPEHEKPEDVMRDIAQAREGAGYKRHEVETVLAAMVAQRLAHLIPEVLDSVFGHEEHTIAVVFKLSGGSPDTARWALQSALDARFTARMPLRDSVTFDEFTLEDPS